jgi:hypothetical protein
LQRWRDVSHAIDHRDSTVFAGIERSEWLAEVFRAVECEVLGDIVAEVA